MSNQQPPPYQQYGAPQAPRSPQNNGYQPYQPYAGYAPQQPTAQQPYAPPPAGYGAPSQPYSPQHQQFVPSTHQQQHQQHQGYSVPGFTPAPVSQGIGGPPGTSSQPAQVGYHAACSWGGSQASKAPSLSCSVVAMHVHALADTLPIRSSSLALCCRANATLPSCACSTYPPCRQELGSCPV